MEAASSRLRDFATRYTAAWCSQDPAKVAAFYSPDGSLIVNRTAPARGRSAITEVARSFMTAFPDLRVVMDQVLVQGDGAEYHWTLFGHNTGPGGTGHLVRISGFESWQIGPDGLIASRRDTSTAPNMNVNSNAESKDGVLLILRLLGHCAPREAGTTG